jgi:hypothetical protein
VNQDGGFIWLASYPKSGNTWMRCLLEAYRTNGHLDINDMRVSIGDSARCIYQAVSPISVHKLSETEAFLLRPAALLCAMSMAKKPRIVKTHFANGQADGAPPFIPKPFTYKAVYIVRDPRSVALSMSRHFGMSQERCVEALAHPSFMLGTMDEGDDQTPIFVGSWSQHAESWCNEKGFPVLLLKYEDLLERPEEMLKGVVEFLYGDYDEVRGRKAIKAASLKSLQKAEAESGFQERSGKTDRFFTAGGQRWEQELGPKYIAQIEKQNARVMKRWGYL